MSEIKFVEVDAKSINEDLINTFEEAFDETLYEGDERRIFLEQETPIIVGLKNSINETAKQNLLKYAADDVLDALGELSMTERLQATFSYTTLRITLSALREMDTIIPSGTRGTPDGIIYFVTTSNLIIKSGTLYGDVLSKSNSPGEQCNGFVAGQIKTLVDPIPYVSSITNIDTSHGGTDTESDDNYRERIRNAPRATSTAGPEGAYEYWSKSADVNISDVKVTSPSPGVVLITVLMKNGELASDDILNKVLNACNSKDRRPLTDNVKTSNPKISTYNINLTYYLDKNFADCESQYRKIIEGENLDCTNGVVRNYIDYHKNKLGKSISSDELAYEIQTSATYMTIDNKSHTVIKKVVFDPTFDISIEETSIAKCGTLTVKYGGVM